MTCLVKITRMNLKVESPSCQAFKENQVKKFREIREGLLEKVESPSSQWVHNSNSFHNYRFFSFFSSLFPFFCAKRGEGSIETIRQKF